MNEGLEKIEEKITDFWTDLFKSLLFFLNQNQQALIVSFIHYAVFVVGFYYFFFQSKPGDIYRIIFFIFVVLGATITGNIGQFTNLTGISGTFTDRISGAIVTGDAGRFTNITGTSGVFTTQISGAVITGNIINSTTGNFISGNFTALSGTTITGSTVQFANLTGISGTFTTQLSGATITGNNGQFTNLTGVSGTFTNRISGATITGNVGQFINLTGVSGTFTTLSGTTTTGTTANFASGVFTTQISGATVVATTIELGNASDTTLSRSASGVLAVEGVVIPSISSTNTLTNKTLTDPAIIGTIIEDVFTITDAAAFEVDPGNGSVQLITLGASRTPKATNFVAGESVTLMVNDGTAYTLTWTDATWGTSGVIWKGGGAPTLATAGYSVIQFWKVSTQIYGVSVGDVA